MRLQSIIGRCITGIGISLVVVLVPSCGGAGDSSEEAPSAQPAASQAATGGSVARADFVLCPAIEEIADSLASIVGFTRDRDRQVQGIGSECFVRGERYGWIKVEMPPAVIRSIAMHIGGYDAEPSPAPELGSDAVYVPVRTQPHVVFPLLGQIIDVGAEGVSGTPDRATVIAVATLVRDALLAANGG